MTLEQCVDALDNLLSRDFTYEGVIAKARFASHAEAVETIFNARKALVEMHKRTYL